ncbi:ABC transporter substrate-binding protein [Paenibacillus sp. JMULE4]|uniref:ABC transporter substrate-binding protein n=1 Tax=Paenibacillus TaxID=44249 RepID=UPI0015766769|nr:ABC transporter substrate-binding protein [Paenibacillus sp. JMULE4]NTZ17394.1 ABC transporter substrate-binding protein [Paenibacillus sp. JMULE4]
MNNRNSLKRAPVFFTLLLLMSSLLGACTGGNSTDGSPPPSPGPSSSGGGSGEKKEITFIAAQYSNATEPFLRKVVSAFEQANQDIKVNLQVVGWDVLEQKINTMVSTQQTPDILNLNHYAAFAADDLLLPLDEVISPNLKSKFYESFYKAGELDGKSYGLPLLASIRGLYYNKDLFEQAGIKEPPATWDELRQTAKAIKEQTGVDGFGVPMTTFEGQAYFSYFIWGNGGDWKKGDQWVLNSPENVEGLQYLTNLVRNDKVTNPEPTAINRDELQKVFGAGKVGMMITANFLPTILKADAPNLKYGVAPIPVNAGKQPFNLGVQDFLMVFKSTKNKEAVGKFLEFLYEDQRYEEFMKNEGMLPATKSVGESLSKQDPLAAQFISQLPIAKFYPLNDPKFTQIRLETIKAVQQSLLGQKSPKQALDDLQKIAEQ